MQVWTVCDSNILLLDGETGAIDEMLPVPGGAGGWTFVYGGAADADGNFWGLDTGNGQLVRVDFETLAVQSWALGPSGGYGITVDSVGRPWTCGGGGVARFNIDSATWDTNGFGGIGGCMTDGDQLIWHSNDWGLLQGFDIETLAVEEEIQLPEYVHGVSVDFQGKVWGVGFANNNAYRADPATDDVDAYNGLFGAYTYSDMTGFALSTAGGGGMPPG
jgi:streptogramin lyase